MKNNRATRLCMLLVSMSFMLNGGNSSSSSRTRGKTQDSLYDLGALIVFSGAGRIDGVKKCLDAAVDVNGEDAIGSTPLGGAVVFEREGVVSLLLDRGACPHKCGRGECSPLRTCLIQHEPEKVNKNILDLLLSCKCSHPVDDQKFQMPEQLIASLLERNHPYTTRQAQVLALALKESRRIAHADTEIKA